MDRTANHRRDNRVLDANLNAINADGTAIVPMLWCCRGDARADHDVLGQVGEEEATDGAAAAGGQGGQMADGASHEARGEGKGGEEGRRKAQGCGHW